LIERSAGWAGIFCVIAVAIALFLPGPALPSAADQGQVVGEFIDSHRVAWMAGAWLTFPEMAFFLWFTVGLRSYLRRNGDADDSLTLYMLGGALGTVAAGLVATTLQIVLGIVPIHDLTLPGTRALYVGWLASGVPVLFMPLALMLFAAAYGMHRCRSTPGWLAGLGYVTAAASVLATFTTFYSAGALALSGPIGYLAFFLFALWIVLTSVRLIAGNARTPSP
jgi:hypothetical protein